MKKFGVLLILAILAIPFVGIVQADDPNTDTNSLPGHNMLVNSGFEQPGPNTVIGEPDGSPWYAPPLVGAKRWWKWGGGGCLTTDISYIEDDAAGAHLGTDYIQLKYMNTAGWIGFTQNVIDYNDTNDIHPGTNYTQSIYARGGQAGDKFQFKLEFYKSPEKFYPPDCSPQEKNSPVYTLTTFWRNYDTAFEAPAGVQKFHVSYFVAAATGASVGETVYFDDANLIEGGAVSPCSRARYDAMADPSSGYYWDRLPGDINTDLDGTVGDCYVNMLDLEIWVEDWLEDCYVLETCHSE